MTQYPYFPPPPVSPRPPNRWSGGKIALVAVGASLGGVLLIALIAGTASALLLRRLEPTASPSPVARATAPPTTATPAPQSTPASPGSGSLKQYEGAIDPLVTTEAKDMTQMAADCSSGDAQTCSNDAGQVNGDAQAIQKARQQNPAPACAQQGDQDLGSAQQMVITSTTDIQNGIKQSSNTLVSKGGNELGQAISMLAQATSELSSSSC